MCFNMLHQRRTSGRITALLVTAIAPATAAFAGELAINWSTIDCGGASTGGLASVSGTIGQADASPWPMVGGGFTLMGGFWADVVSITISPCPPDLNGDGDVNGADLGILLSAWGPSTSTADLNEDGVVDGADLGALLAAWGGCEA